MLMKTPCDKIDADVTGRKLRSAEIVPRLPDCRGSKYGDELPLKMVGAKILSVGTTDEQLEGDNLEGGGLIVDYHPKDASAPMRVALSFNELGMWIVYNGPISIR